MRFVAIYAAHLTEATGFHISVEILVPVYIGIREKKKQAFSKKHIYQIDCFATGSGRFL